MKTLISYEIKKIVMKKSTIVAFLLLLTIQCFLSIAGSLGATYVDDKFVETHMERNRIDRENGIALSGRTMDDQMLEEVRQAYQKLGADDDERYQLSEVYQNEVRKYSDIYARFRMWGLSSMISGDMVADKDLYEIREESCNAMWEDYELSDKERQYWQDKEDQLTKPFSYKYATAYEYLLSMQGAYMIGMLITFFIAISIVSVFTEEHNRKTDQLVLCTRKGRGMLYVAKLLSACIVVLVTNLVFIAVTVAGNFFSYGVEGFGAKIQMVVNFCYSYDLTVGEALLIVMSLLILSSLMVAIVTMVLAELLRNSLGAMAIIIGGLFAARIVSIPPGWRIASRLWNYIPINLLKVDQGFTDLRLVSLFGIRLTIWQFAPIAYVLIILIISFIGSKIYQRYQVSGR